MRFAVATIVALAALASSCGEGMPATFGTPQASPGPDARGVCDHVWTLSSGPETIRAGAEAYRSWVRSSSARGFVTRITPIIEHGGFVLHHLFVTRGAATLEDPVRPVLFAGGRASRAVELPRGTGLPLAAGEELELGLHVLNTTNREVSFAAGIELCTMDEITTEAGVVSFGPEELSIPADHVEHSFAASCPVQGERSFFAAWPHMHSRGTRIRVALGSQTLVEVLPWNASEQPLYPIEPVHTGQGGQPLTVSCSFVNSGTSPVGWGHFAEDEMCLAFVYYFPAGLAQGWGCGGG